VIVLPFPDKALWPNGRAHWATKSRAFAKHKAWAFNATKANLPRCFKWNGELVKLRYTITPKTAHKIDRDNCVAAMKAYQDGIALALGIDDSAFAVPMIEFAEPRKPGGVEVVL
jgi:crossover junction endodeoxyribonuclease RusA